MASDVRAILALEVPIIVVLGERTMKVSEVCALSPGAIIELPNRAEDELTLQVNNKPVGAGIAVKVGENFGIRITFIGDLKSRIAALGGGEAKAAPAAGGGDDLAALAEAMLAGQG
jgi:flagellar motor switch protein FliN/FliY